MAVDLADIDAGEPAGEEIGDRCLQLHRDLQVVGKMVERAERQDAERVLGADQRRGDRVLGAVAAAGDDGLAALRHGAARELRDLAAARGKEDARSAPCRANKAAI